MRSLWLSSSAIASFVALGAFGGTLTSASAHYTTTRCDRDGDECYVVRCDDDGDDCRTVSSYNPYNYRRGYGGRYGNGYSGWNGFSFYYNNDRRYDRYYGDYYGRYRHHERDDDDDD